MAVSATVIRSPISGRLMVEKVVTLSIDGAGEASETVNLSEAFQNTPTMLITIPLGSDADYVLAYVAGTPAITITVGGVSAETVLLSTDVDVVLVAVDRSV